MAVWEFAPTAFVTGGTDYGSGVVGSIDEWVPAGGADRIQSANTAASGTRSGTVSFNLSTATNLTRGLLMVMSHTGSASGWSVSAQLKVNSVNVGDPVVVSRPLVPTAERWSFFRWPAATGASLATIMAAVAANPSLVQVTWTATNLHTTTNQHHVWAVRMFVSPLTGAAPIPAGITVADVKAAWDLKATASLWTDGVAIDHLPDLIGGSHLIRSQGSMLFETDETCGIPSNVMYGGQIPDIMTDAWMIHIIKTAPSPILEDHEPVMSNFNKDGGVDGSAVLYASINYKVLSTLDIGEGLVGGWGVMADSLSQHFFSNGWDNAGTAFPGSTWFCQVYNLRTAVNERMYVTKDAAPTTGNIVVDANGAGTTNKLKSVGLLNREDGSRGRAGFWRATYIFDGALTDTVVFGYADIIAKYHGLWTGVAPPPKLVKTAGAGNVTIQWKDAGSVWRDVRVPA